jgi:probable addiction module antidote protein
LRHEFDVLDHLATIEEQIAYLEVAPDQSDPSFIATAIGDVARARGVSQFARETGLSREVRSTRLSNRAAIQRSARSTKR